MTSIDQIITTYFKAWNALTREEVGRFIDESCSPGIFYIDPKHTCRGAVELADRIYRGREVFPGFRVSVTSALDGYDRTSRYTWDFEAPGYEGRLDGLDVVTQGPDGRITALTSFFGNLQSIERGAPLRIQARWGT